MPGVGGSGDGGFREASVQGPNARGSRSARGAPSSPAQCRRKRKMEGSVWRTEAVNRPPHEPPLIPPAPGRTTRPAPLRGCCPGRAGFYPQIQQGVTPRSPLPLGRGRLGWPSRGGARAKRPWEQDISVAPTPPFGHPFRLREGRVADGKAAFCRLAPPPFATRTVPLLQQAARGFDAAWPQQAAGGF